MRALLALCATLFALRSTPLHAQHEGAIAGGMAASAATANSGKPEPDDRHPGTQLEDWSDARSGGTVRAATGCGGVTLEVTLSATHTQSFATVTIANDAETPIAVLPRASRFRFDAGSYRRFSDPGSDVRLAPGWLTTRTLAFPDKESFEGKRALELEVRVAPESQPACALRVVFERNRDVPESAHSHVSYSALDLELGAGPRFVQTGGIGELGRGVSLHLDFSGFFGVHHGLTFSLVADLHGRSAVDDIAPAVAADTHPSISGTGFLAGYVGRIYIAPWLTAAYSATTGPYVFELTADGEEGPVLSTAVLPLRHRVRIAADFLTLRDGTRFAIAASLTQLLVPYGRFGRVELRGSSLAATLELMIGG